ncbi:hypothetical protein TNCT_641741 [Trichonephila clavata]|uniref:Uncharacterized protein n=1 Tax=Trichonephila clavata TaxID=2740835 RepID=A0A8X6KGT1_TRICU|nr:hypothetical protein TNCT_641741 [Trichonephila clavata]
MSKFWVFVYRNANDNHIIAATEEFSDESASLRHLGSSFETNAKEVRWTLGGGCSLKGEVLVRKDLTVPDTSWSLMNISSILEKTNKQKDNRIIY